MRGADRRPQDLLLEVGTEEIPARFLPRALEQLEAVAQEHLARAALNYQALRALGTPRRLVLHVEALASRQEDRVREVLGPPRKIGLDAQGKPTRAAEGFARSQGVPVSALEVRTTERGEYLCAVIREEGRPTADVLPEILPGILASLSFPKSMRWNESRVRFARPIRWILCLYGDAVIAFTFGGIASGRTTRGHAILFPESVPVPTPEAYFRILEERGVVLDPIRRRTQIREQLQAVAQVHGGRPLEDARLLEEVTHLVECPSVVAGTFEAGFLSLPREVLITVLQTHQRFFPVEGEQGLLPVFLGVSNVPTEGRPRVQRGYERVVRARLADARFFYEADRQRPLAERVAELAGVVYLEGLGTLLDKTHRLERLAPQVAQAWGCTPEKVQEVAQAARLAKADLVTEMVGEFPELQGIMGAHYAREDGLPEAVARALADCDRPRHAGDALPQTRVGAALAVADRLDHLVGCFSLGLIPTGSQDPFALRRQALGLVSVWVDQRAPGSLAHLVQQALEAYGARIPPDRHGDLQEQVLRFLRDRAEGWFVSRGQAYDTVRTVLAPGMDNPWLAWMRIEALETMRKDPAFEALILSHRRAQNILRQARETGKVPGEGLPPVQPDRFQEEEEVALHQALAQVIPQVEEALGEEAPLRALQALASLKEPIDRFFDTVLVMSPEESIRLNRLALLAEIVALFARFGDFSQIVLEGG